MAMKKKTVRRKVTQLKRESTSRLGRLKQVVDPKAAEQRIKRTWNDTVEALSTAEARVEKEIRGLLKRNRISTRDAATAVKDVRALIGRERKKGMKELEARFASLSARVRKEGKNASQKVDDAVLSALATFNIPSRTEVHQLTRKVNELSKKIDSFKRR
jgi:poly(hydroxyalkanoate) granule associated protein phasin